MKKVYVVDLTKGEKTELLKLVGKGQARARKMNRAHILLLADEGRTDKDIAKALHTSPSTVERTCRRLVEGGLEQALNESPRPGGRRKLTGKQEAYEVPTTEKVRVVLDNLNTHTPASLYKAFEPEEARRLLHRLEFHHTPTHASWLNMVEIELSVLSRQCLERRIPDTERLAREIGAWEHKRNEGGAMTAQNENSTSCARSARAPIVLPLASTRPSSVSKPGTHRSEVRARTANIAA